MTQTSQIKETVKTLSVSNKESDIPKNNYIYI